MNLKQTPTLLAIAALIALLSSVFGLRAGSEESQEPERPPSTVQQETPTSPQSEQQGEEAGAGEEKDDNQDLRWKEQRDLYRQFFGQLPATSETASSLFAEIKDQVGDGEYKLGTLIALVPDPLDSHLSYRFDEALEGILKAYADAGFLFERRWLPWEGKPEGHPYRQSPGILLFRRFNGHFDSGHERRLEAVLLVGESPKNGIQKGAFFEAVELAKLQGGPVRIVGPTFSGSVESLRLCLRQLLPQRMKRPEGSILEGDPFSGSAEALQQAWSDLLSSGLQFVVFSGSATTETLEALFDNNFGKSVWFGRTVVPDDSLQKSAFCFFKKRLGWRGRIALLSESDTAYGQRFSFRHNKAAKSRTDTCPDSPLTVLRFPSHLGHIRTAREKNGLRNDTEEAKAGGSTSLSLEPARQNLDLSLADEETAVDVIPELSSLTTTINDLVLSDLLQTISRERIRYVGIAATDVQDRLFLAEQLRTYAPNVVLFTFDHHLLDTHPQFASAMDGTLVLSSYPFLAQRRNETAGGSARFSSDLQMGIYQAATALLQPLPDLRLPSPPQVWISVVSNGSLLPLATLRSAKAIGPPAPRWVLLRAGREGNEVKWIIAGLGLCLLAYWLWRLARPLRKAGDEAPPDWDASWVRSWARDSRWLPALGILSLALPAGLLLALYSLRTGNLASNGMFWFLTLVYTGMIGAGVWLCSPASRSGRSLLLWIAAGTIALLVLRTAIMQLWIPLEGEEFAFARIANITSGLSPLVPLGVLFAAVYTWTLLELKRRQLIALQGIEWPLRLSREPPLREIQVLTERLDEGLGRALPDWKLWVVVLLLFALPQRRLHEGIQPISEAAAYGWPFLALVALGFILSAISFYRFFSTWKRVERVLDRLCHTWLLREFTSDTDLFDWKPMKSFGWRMPTFKMAVVSIDRLRRIETLGLLESAGGERLADLDARLTAAFAAEQGHRFEAEVAARRAGLDCLTQTAKELETVRRDLGGEEPVPLDAAGKPKERPQEAEIRRVEEFLALRVVSYLRYVFAHLRNTLLSAMLCGLMVLVGVTLYTFEPKQFFSFGLWVNLLGATLLTIWAFVQMDRNGALSAIGGTAAGQVTFNRTFLTNVFTYGGVPLIGVVVTQLPIVGRVFSQWIEPLLRVVGAK